MVKQYSYLMNMLDMIDPPYQDQKVFQALTLKKHYVSLSAYGWQVFYATRPHIIQFNISRGK